MRYFIILITSIWFLVGCEDLLDMEPKNSLTYGNSMTEKELEASVRGAVRKPYRKHILSVPDDTTNGR